MFSINNLRQRSVKLGEEIQSLKNYLDKTDFSEHLVARMNLSGSFDYAKRIKDQDGHRHEEYLAKAKCDEIHDLAYAAYAPKRLKDAKAEKKALDAMIRFLSKESHVSQLMKDRPGVAAALKNWLAARNDDNLSASEQEIKEKARQWTRLPYSRSTYNPNDLKYPTIVPGLLVRSKAEADIISRFEYFGAAYHYEEEWETPEHLITLYGRNSFAFHPDFKVKNMRTGNVFWWEHQGGWDNPKYVANMARRETDLFRMGLIPWKNLIITTETLAQPLDLLWVDEIIQFYLL